MFAIFVIYAIIFLSVFGMFILMAQFVIYEKQEQKAAAERYARLMAYAAKLDAERKIKKQL